MSTLKTLVWEYEDGTVKMLKDREAAEWQKDYNRVMGYAYMTYPAPEYAWIVKTREDIPKSDKSLKRQKKLSDEFD